MSVKTILSVELGKIILYPKLMIASDGLVVLFTSDCQGTIIASKGYENIGYYAIGWDMEAFKDYIGEVTLKNE